LKIARGSTSSPKTRVGSVAAVLALIAALSVLAAPAGGAIHGNHTVGTLILRRIKSRYPRVRQVFINCPPGNPIPPVEDKHHYMHPGIGCEFRFLTGSRVVKGDVEAGEKAGKGIHGWFLAYFEPGPAAPLGRHRCKLPLNDEERRMKVVVYDESCVEAALVVRELGGYAEFDKNHRLPSHLSIGEENGLFNGFVTRRFHCRDHTHKGTPGSRPHIHEEAVCRTRFGDTVIFSADQYY
jgi:hypothetical protein